MLVSYDDSYFGWLKVVEANEKLHFFLMTFKMRTLIDNVLFLFFRRIFFFKNSLTYSYSSSLVFFVVIWPESWASLVCHIGDSNCNTVLLQHSLASINHVLIGMLGYHGPGITGKGFTHFKIKQLKNGRNLNIFLQILWLKGSLLNSLLPWWRMKMDSLCHP